VWPFRGNPERDQCVAFGIRDVEQAVRGRAHVRRADADRGRAQRPAVWRVGLDPAAPHPDDNDGRPVAGGGHTAGLQGRGLDGDLLPAAHQGHRVRVLVAHEDHRAGRGRVVRLVTYMSVRHHLAARQGELDQLVGLLRGDEDWAGGSCELQVPRRARQPYYLADPSGRDVHQRHRVWPAQADREDAPRIVRRQPFGGAGHRHHRASRCLRQRWRPSRFRHIGPSRNGTPCRNGTPSRPGTPSRNGIPHGPGRPGRIAAASRPASSVDGQDG
jgi:hypothetical protein